MSFDVFVVVAAVIGSVAVFAWLQIRTSQQLQYERQQVQFWSKVLSNNATS